MQEGWRAEGICRKGVSHKTGKSWTRWLSIYYPPPVRCHVTIGLNSRRLSFGSSTHGCSPNHWLLQQKAQLHLLHQRVACRPHILNRLHIPRC